MYIFEFEFGVTVSGKADNGHKHACTTATGRPEIKDDV